MKEMTAVATTRHPRGGQVIAIARRALRALRHVNDELLRAGEAIIGSARAPQPRRAQQDRPRVQAPGRGDLETHLEHRCPRTEPERAGCPLTTAARVSPCRRVHIFSIAAAPDAQAGQLD
jgi:hypothetical protein